MLTLHVEDIKELDWGTRANESFIAYITRIERQIDDTLKVTDIKPELVGVIVGIFETTCFNTPDKLQDVIKILRLHLGREPVISDYNKLVDYIRERLYGKIQRKALPLILTA